MIERIIIIWKSRENKFPWITTSFTLVMFCLSCFIGMIEVGIDGNYIYRSYIFCFTSRQSLILWISVSFLIGYLKNQNLSQNYNLSSGTTGRAFVYGFGLYFGMFSLFIFNESLFINPALDKITQNYEIMTLESFFLSGVCSALGAFISVIKRGPLYPEFLINE